MILLSLHVTFIISITVNGQQEALTSDTARLKSDLFKNYDHAKPAKGTIVYLVFVPTYMQPSETEEVMFVTGQMFIYWHDTRLVWAPEAYNGITKFQYHGADRLNNVNIWVPKIIATTVDGFDYRLVRLHLAWLVVHSYGLVEVQLNWGDQISCIHDHASFPYDQNNCSVSFHSIAPTMSGTDGWQFELQAGTITESSIQYQHTATALPLVANGFSLLECTFDTWYHNFAYRNGSTERPDEESRRKFWIMEFVRLRIALTRRSPWFNGLFKVPLVGLNLVTTAGVCSSRRTLAAFLLAANILLHAILISGFLAIAPLGESLPAYGWLAASSLVINCFALIYRLSPESIYDKGRVSTAVISGVICALTILATLLYA